MIDVSNRSSAFRSQPEAIFPAEHVHVRLLRSGRHCRPSDPSEARSVAAAGRARHHAALVARRHRDLRGARRVCQQHDVRMLSKERDVRRERPARRRLLSRSRGTAGGAKRHEACSTQQNLHRPPEPWRGRPRSADDHFASGSGRIWNRTTLLVVPFPPSMWNGARVLTVDHKPRPFHPPFGSSIRPSSHFV